MLVTSTRMIALLITMILISSCKIENTIEGSGGFYTENNQSLSK